jgi:hypothetical protein
MDKKRYIKQNFAGTYRNKIRGFFEYAQHKQHKTVSDLIDRNADLLYVLVYQRVMSANELIKFLEFPKARVFKSLKELKNCKFVIQVNFENHTLYAINGHYLHFIKTLLRYDELTRI